MNAWAWLTVGIVMWGLLIAGCLLWMRERAEAGERFDRAMHDYFDKY